MTTGRINQVTSVLCFPFAAGGGVVGGGNGLRGRRSGGGGDVCVVGPLVSGCAVPWVRECFP